MLVLMSLILLGFPSLAKEGSCSPASISVEKKEFSRLLNCVMWTFQAGRGPREEAGSGVDQPTMSASSDFPAN